MPKTPGTSFWNSKQQNRILYIIVSMHNLEELFSVILVHRYGVMDDPNDMDVLRLPEVVPIGGSMMWGLLDSITKQRPRDGSVHQQTCHQTTSLDLSS